MDPSIDKWSVHLARHVAFFGYRWVAWVLAGLALAWPGETTGTITRDAGLMLLLLSLNVVLTAFGQPYVRTVRQHGGLLGVDLLASVAFLWMTGGNSLPFLPYALGALVLPALIYGLRGAVISAAGFAALDALGRMILAPPDAQAEGFWMATVRLLLPLVFALAWVLVGQRLLRNDRPTKLRSAAPTGAFDAQQVIAPPPTNARPRFSDPSADRRLDRPTTEMVDPAPLAIARTVPAPRFDPIRQMLFDLTPDADLALAETIEQIALGVGRQSGIAIRTTVIGAPQPLNPAQQMVLLRTAQEALLNVQHHAQARNVQIMLTFEANSITLVVQDDGVGLLDGTYERPGLHALRAVRYRLVELDGQLSVVESEQGGVIVRATIPLI